MFGDLMGNMQQQQEELQKNLGALRIETHSSDGLIKVECNALREILNISVSETLLHQDHKDQLEDLLVITLNKALNEAAAKEAIEAQKLLQNIMPSGLGGLGDMFK
jgi:nucleoid-associated protein EbfC